MIANSLGKRDFQSVQGPSDPFLRSSEIEGYQPVSRIGEIVMNSFGTRFLPSLFQTSHTYIHTT
jgi:hypothetical protein